MTEIEGKVRKPKIIVIEGMDCSGKTSLINELKKLKLPIVFSREPGGTPFSEAVRSLILSTQFQISAKSQALLFLCARSEHIEWFKTQTTDILIDRYYLSTLVYQCYLSKIDYGWVKRTQEYISDSMKPAVTFVLAVTEESHRQNHLKRANMGNSNKLDNHSFQEMKKAYEWAIACLRGEGEKVIVLNGTMEQNVKIIQAKLEKDLL